MANTSPIFRRIKALASEKKFSMADIIESSGMKKPGFYESFWNETTTVVVLSRVAKKLGVLVAELLGEKVPDDKRYTEALKTKRDSLINQIELLQKERKSLMHEIDSVRKVLRIYEDGDALSELQWNNVELLTRAIKSSHFKKFTRHHKKELVDVIRGDSQLLLDVFREVYDKKNKRSRSVLGERFGLLFTTDAFNSKEATELLGEYLLNFIKKRVMPYLQKYS